MTALKRQNKRLRAEIKRLKKQNQALKAAMRSTPQGQLSPHEIMLSDRGQAVERFEASTYLGYLLSWLKASSLWRLTRKVARIFRRLRVVRWVTQLILLILTFLLASAVFLSVLPALLLLMLTATLTVTLRAGIRNRKLKNALRGKHIYVMLPQKSSSLHPDSFFVNCAKDLAHTPHTAVGVVSPYNLSSRGLGGRGVYFTARQESENLYIVRKSYYFILKRKVLTQIDPQMVVMG